MAAFSIGNSGGVNSVLFAMEILALADSSVREKLVDFRKDQREKVLEKSKRLQQKIKDV